MEKAHRVDLEAKAVTAKVAVAKVRTEVLEAPAAVAAQAERAEQAWFCACKRTGNRPMCDGSHKKLAP